MTDRKLRRKSKPASTAQLRAMLEALDKSQAIIEFELDGTILKANENFLNVMGYSLDEIVGQHHSLFVPAEFAQSKEYQDFWETLRTGTFQTAEYLRLGKGGKEVWIQASYNPIRDKRGRLVKVVKYASDITEAKMHTADFEGQIKAIGKSQAVIHFDLDGIILDANENFLATLGYTLDEIKGEHHRKFVETQYGQSQEYKDFWAALVRGEFQAAEYKRIGKGGRDVWIQVSYNPIFDPMGRPFKVVKYATDITKQVLGRQENERIGGIVDSNLEKIVATVSNASSSASVASDVSARTASSVEEIAQTTTVSRDAVRRALDETKSADQSTDALSKATESMNSIVEMINNIASQIHLLALNATIEAARAGEAGKGFAVVATEVKTLADQVASATESIVEEINQMQVVSGDVVERLQGIHQAIESVEQSVTVVASAVEEQSSASREVSENMQNASQAVQEIDDSLQTIAQSTEEAVGFAQEGSELYRELRQQSA
jgi:methyl-accepting chemotaxis protein